MVTDFIYADEDGKLKIGFKGKLYLENNLILRKTLQEDVDKLVNSCDGGKADGLYFFENFAKVWKLNTCKNIPDSQEVFQKYKEITEALKKFVNRNGRKDFSEHINALFEALGVGGLKALAFLHDGNRENELFEFFTVAGKLSESGGSFNCGFEGLSASQAFFHDDNINQIRTHITNGEDIFFIDNVLNENIECDRTHALIVRFHANKGINVYKNVDNQDDSIYFQIWGFEQTQMLHWFALKLLLTLRDNFITLINEINLQELIEERKVTVQKEALAINKAVTHSQSQNFFIGNIISSEIDIGDRWVNFRHNSVRAKQVVGAISEDLLTDALEKEITESFISGPDEFCSEPSERSIYSAISKIPNDHDVKFVVFDRYFQLLSNEIVSSLYRKIIKGENIELINEDRTRLLFSLYKLFDYKKIGDDRYQITFNIKSNEQLKNVKADFDFLDNKDGYVPCLNFVEGSIDGWTFLILIMATNFAEHNASKGNPMTVMVKRNYIQFKNPVEQITEDYKKYINIPPWQFGGNDQHITLWTFKHIKIGGLSCDIQQSENNFIVTFSF